MSKIITVLFSASIFFVFFNVPILEGTRFQFSPLVLAMMLAAFIFVIFGEQVYKFLNPDRPQYISMNWK